MELPVLLLEPAHLKMVSAILDEIKGKPHVVSFDIIGLSFMSLMRTALKFKDAMVQHQDRINASIKKITIHVCQDSVSVVQDMIERCKENGLVVPVEICVQSQKEPCQKEPCKKEPCLT